jgi:hypothetical protein
LAARAKLTRQKARNAETMKAVDGDRGRSLNMD